MNNFDEENDALDIYCKLYNLKKDFFNDILKTESPDIQTKNNDIGIEVTRVLKTKHGELEFFSRLIQGKTREQITLLANENKQLQKFIRNKNILFHGKSSGIFYGIGDNIKPILDSIEDKLNKLQEYKKFDKNVLFLIIKFQILDKTTIERFIIQEIIKLEKNFECKYDEYIIFDYLKNILFIIDSNKQVKEVYINLN